MSPHSARVLHYGGLFAILILLKACAVNPPQEIAILTPAWLSHQQQISMIKHWRLHGKLSLQYKDQRVNYKISWQCRDRETHFDLYTLLGQKVLEFSNEKEQAWLKDRSGSVSYADSAESLMEENLGIAIPIFGICDWAKGIPHEIDKTELLRVDNHNQLVELQQSQWHLVYHDYIQTEGLRLPRKISLRKDKIQIILLVNDWELGEMDGQ